MAEGYRQLALAERKKIERGLSRGGLLQGDSTRDRQEPVDRLA